MEEDEACPKDRDCRRKGRGMSIEEEEEKGLQRLRGQTVDQMKDCKEK